MNRYPHRFLRLYAVCLVFFCILMIESCASYKGSPGGMVQGDRYYDHAKPASPKAEEKAIGGMDKKAKTRDYKEAEADEEAGETSPVKKTERMIIYTADYTVHVDSVRNSMKVVSDIADKYRGFIESADTSDSYSYAVIVIRIPVKSFETVLKDVETMGTVIQKNISASDVTAEFNDVSLRIKTARKVRDRMYELLKRVRDVKERVKILREIERLNNIIDSYTARINYLKNKASYSTLVLRLRARVRDTVRRYIPSPFGWIARLKPEERSLFDRGDVLEYGKLRGFFELKENFYSKNGKFLFQTPDQSAGLRIGYTDNYPPADARFWKEAFELDLTNRMYKVPKTDGLQGNRGLAFRVYDISLFDGSLHTVAWAVTGKYILVVEIRYRDEEAFKKYSGDVMKFMRTVGVK